MVMSKVGRSTLGVARGCPSSYSLYRRTPDPFLANFNLPSFLIADARFLISMISLRSLVRDAASSRFSSSTSCTSRANLSGKLSIRMRRSTSVFGREFQMSSMMVFSASALAFFFISRCALR